MRQQFATWLVGSVILVMVLPAAATGFAGTAGTAAVVERAGTALDAAGFHVAPAVGLSHLLSKTRAGLSFSGPATAMWTTPRSVGTCASSASNEIALFAVGASDNVTGAPPAAQVGTGFDCNAGRVSYFAWYEFGTGPITHVNLTFARDDLMQAWIFSNGSQVVLLDKSTNAWTGYITGPNRTSSLVVATLLVERPLVHGSVAALPDFGSVTFWNNSALLSGALTNGTSYTMTNGGPTAIVARTGHVGAPAARGGFIVYWV